LPIISPKITAQQVRVLTVGGVAVKYTSAPFRPENPVFDRSGPGYAIAVRVSSARYNSFDTEGALQASLKIFGAYSSN